VGLILTTSAFSQTLNLCEQKIVTLLKTKKFIFLLEGRCEYRRFVVGHNW